MKISGYRAFWGCKSLKSMTIPDNVKCIGDGAFEDCSNLTSITIPDSVTRIGRRAFMGCSSLTSITIPDSVTSIGENAFMVCTSLTSITIPDSVTKIGDWTFCGCTSLTSITIPNSVTSIGEYVFDGCKNLESLNIEGNAQLISENCFGDNLPKKLIPEIIKCVSNMSDVTIKKYILTKEVWDSLSNEGRFNLFMTRHGKTLTSGYANVVDAKQATEMGGRMLKVFDGTPSAAECNAVAEFLILCGVNIDDELINQLFDSLENTKNGKKAVNRILKDAYLLKRCSGKANKLSEIDRIAVELMKADGLSPNQVEVKCNDLYSSICLPEIVDTAGNKVPSYILAYLLCAHESKNKKRMYGDPDILPYNKPQIRPELHPLLDMIDKNSFQNALKTIAVTCLGLSGKSKKMCLAYPICRYGSDELMEEYTKIAPKWRSSNSGSDAPPLRTFRDAIMYNNSRAAMLFAEKYKELDKYAEIRGTTADAIRDRFLSDVGLDENGTTVYDLGSQSITVKMLPDFTFSLTTSEGKTVKSIPKKGSDEVKYAEASKSFTALKKTVKSIVSSRKKVLFDCFLNGTERKADEWISAYQNNPILHQIASLIVWSQGKSTFTLNESGAIKSDGTEYKIGKSPIAVAHPMEMKESDVTAWQKYFSDRKLKQPFLQIWEPVVSSDAIKSDRYKNAEIPFNYFRGAEKHGISIGDWDYHSEIGIYFSDCSCECDFINWPRHMLPEKVAIKEFKVLENSRITNHIVSLLDKWTVAQRIKNDDISVTEIIENASLAQLTYYMDIASQNNATNCMAQLLEIKNRKYSDFDPMDEYSLD